MTWSWQQTKALLRRPARRPAPLPPSAATPTGRPTRPDRLSIWPTEHDTYGIDVLYVGDVGRRRAETVVRQIEKLGMAVTLRDEAGDGWTIRFGPVSREDMLTVLNGYVW